MLWEPSSDHPSVGRLARPKVPAMAQLLARWSVVPSAWLTAALRAQTLAQRSVPMRAQVMEAWMALASVGRSGFLSVQALA